MRSSPSGSPCLCCGGGGGGGESLRRRLGCNSIAKESEENLADGFPIYQSYQAGIARRVNGRNHRYALISFPSLLSSVIFSYFCVRFLGWNVFTLQIIV
jgi:hypothetical protein